LCLRGNMGKYSTHEVSNSSGSISSKYSTSVCQLSKQLCYFSIY
jgi:hypothetical protein